MKKFGVNPAGVLAAIGILGLVLNADISLRAGADALDLCIHTVIPSLFPFIFLTKIINSGTMFAGPGFMLLEKICKLPQGSGSVFAMGLLGGYPIGAQLVYQRLKSKQISHFQAIRMLTFSNNPGPAFIFGICGLLFRSTTASFALWGIQIISAMIIAFLLPADRQGYHISEITKPDTVRVYLKYSIYAMACICGWIVLFRVILSICNVWIIGSFPSVVKIILTGAIELTNGCLELMNIQNPALRFVLCSGMLSFGGLCVTMQTASVFPNISIINYTLGKFTQCALCVLISMIVQFILFSTEEQWDIPIPLWFITGVSVALLFFILYSKIRVEKKKNIVYNQEKHG